MTIALNKNEIEKITSRVSVEQLGHIRQFVLFVGHAHSGHSIIGAILDAHPLVAIANEVNIVNLIRKYKLSKIQIESILLHYSFSGGKKKEWYNSEYKHNIEQSHQGETHIPHVIGDKKAGGTTRVLHVDYWVLSYIKSMYKDQLKVIFVNRNALDIVAAYSYYMKQKPCQFHVDRYFENLTVVKKIKNFLSPSSFIEVDQSKFIKNPHAETKRLFDFINIKTQKHEIDSWVAHVKKNIKGKSKQIYIPDKLKIQIEGF